MGRMEKKRLKKTNSKSIWIVLFVLFIVLILGVSLVDRTLGQMTGNNNLRAIGLNIYNDIAIVHFLGKEYDIDYIELLIRLEEAYITTKDRLVKIKEKIISSNVGR